MSTQDWLTPIVEAALQQFQRGSNALTIYLCYDRIWIETTAPRPGDPEFLMFVHAYDFQNPGSRQILDLLACRISSRLKHGMIAEKPQPESEENQS